MNEDQTLRLQLYNQAVERGATHPAEEAQKAYKFIIYGIGSRKKKAKEPGTIEMFPDKANALVNRESADIMCAAGINPPMVQAHQEITESEVVLIPTPKQDAPVLSDAELLDIARKEAAKYPVDKDGVMGVEV